MTGNRKIYSLLGIAAKAGFIKSGGFTVEKSVETGKARLVIVSEDSSENTRKLFRDKCARNGIPLIEFGEKQELGYAVGKGERSSLAVTDAGLASEIRKQLSLNGGIGREHE